MALHDDVQAILDRGSREGVFADPRSYRLYTDIETATYKHLDI